LGSTEKETAQGEEGKCVAWRKIGKQIALVILISEKYDE